MRQAKGYISDSALCVPKVLMEPDRRQKMEVPDQGYIPRILSVSEEDGG